MGIELSSDSLPGTSAAFSEADALRFACNVVNVGKTILLNEVGNDLAAQLQSLGY